MIGAVLCGLFFTIKLLLSIAKDEWEHKAFFMLEHKHMEETGVVTLPPITDVYEFEFGDQIVMIYDWKIDPTNIPALIIQDKTNLEGFVLFDPINALESPATYPTDFSKLTLWRIELPNIIWKYEDKEIRSSFVERKRYQ